MVQTMYPKNGRVILHVDMNSFYASVEVAHDPTLKGKPLAVAGNEKERKGIIITCSYEARAFGIKTTMPLWEAKRLCRDLLIRKPNFDLYREASMNMFQYLYTITPLVQPVSIDEGYMDITDCQHLGSPLEIAERIQKDLLEQFQLPCSIGIAPNKFLAKMASDMKKPLGITVLRKRDVQHVLWPQEVGIMHGVGKATATKLNELHIVTVEDLAKANEGLLREEIGISGAALKERANGIDNRPVDPEAIYQFKTIGNSSTFPQDMTEEAIIFQKLEALALSVSNRLKKKGYMTHNVQVMIRYDNRALVTRSRKLVNPIVAKEDIFSAATFLWRKHWNGNPVRLVGITAHDLTERKEAVKQLDLFSFQEDVKEEPLLHVMEKLKEKYGDHIISKGK
ncbi:DNA polymerase IV [Priestia taiwanensis]|uniref:DNA polymerase IV n=1 Tax=Priestia taiwanensis TaxID=1347902 RepID=A0A917AHV9_9BACI|nr:DNA polymerase IV [Priestia taiwanensis]MBM7361440.1 DNA polymerase-4 [Priestia taiwanensis]GGE54168.1 DNA polymerase IV [Priestia taiwanensis]